MRVRQYLIYGVIAAATAGVTVAVALLLVNIFERKQEARNPYLKLVELTENDVDPQKWGVNWPRQYDGYRRTEEPTATKYGGGLIGPEGGLPPQKAARDPWLTRLFAGYLFSVDYRDRRGHAFMLQDQEITKRNLPAEGKQSGNCLHCHSSIMPLYRKLGREALPQASPEEQVLHGLERVAELTYWDAHQQLTQLTTRAHPVSCVDCHDPQSMELRVTRPAFLTGIRALAASQGAVPHLPSIEQWRRGDRGQPYDPNTDGTRQEMRSFVCAQCHVEYFCGKGMTIFFPWAEGLKVEELERQYNGMQVKGQRFKDWVHAETGMDVLKAQHPEFELWSQGIHARSGVGCADCHMPYKREGALKVSEHWVRSPLLQLNRSCETCHPYGEGELRARVEAIQDRHFTLLGQAGQAAVEMIDALVAVRQRREAEPEFEAQVLARAREVLAASPEYAAQNAEEQSRRLAAELKTQRLARWQQAVREDPRLQELGALQRAAQWRLDFVAAENSMGFHAPHEMARIMAEAIDLARQAQVRALQLGANAGAASVAGTPPAMGTAAPPAPGTAAPPAPGTAPPALPERTR